MAFESLHVPYKPPAREVGSYNAAQRAALKRKFALIGAKSRRIDGIAIYGAYGFLACIIAAGATSAVVIGILGRTISGVWVLAFVIPAALCMIFAIVVSLGSPYLICPGCANQIDQGFGRYCPECGARMLQPATSLFSSPRCYACQKEMLIQKTRRYTIRACTYCGLLLDDEGL